LLRRWLREDVEDWFELDSDSPYMLLVAEVRSLSIAPRIGLSRRIGISPKMVGSPRIGSSQP
jgi:hypothetical protein